MHKTPGDPIVPLARAEAAQVLGTIQEAGTKQHVRALKRLKAILAARPGGLEGL
jgi:hypothetical protein